MKETIGLLMIRPGPVALKGEDEVIIATAFLPAEQLPNGKVKVLSIKRAKQLREMGFRPMVAIRSEVTRHGTKITHCGYELHFIEGVPTALREVIKHFSPVSVKEMLDEYYQNLNATKEAV